MSITIVTIFFAYSFLDKEKYTEYQIVNKDPKLEKEVVVQSFVNIVFVGDIMLDRGVKSSVIKNFGGDYNQLFNNLGELKNADILFANLEGTASIKGRNVGSKYSFQMDPIVIPALANAGFDILSVANNHVGDWTLISYTDSLAHIKENNILYTGGGINSIEAEKPTIIEKNGIRIGFLGFSDVGPDWMKATTNSAGLLIASDPRFDEIIKNASTKVDTLIVSFHFGEEYKPVHNKRQEYLAHRAIDNGAKIIIGHHPHVIEDTEVYKNGFIIYSLGNFIFDQKFSTDTMQGAILNIKLDKDQNMTIRQDLMKLNKFFQPETIIKGEGKEIK